MAEVKHMPKQGKCSLSFPPVDPLGWADPDSLDNL
jgi:hypothetical protein